MSFPIKLQIDLPKPVGHAVQKGWAYEHTFGFADDDYRRVNVWRDPVRHTVSLQPYQLLEEFNTTFGGLLARPRLNSYHKDDGAVSTDWEDVEYQAAGNYFLQAKTTNQRLNTIQRWRPNQAFFIRAYAFGAYGRRDTWFTFELGKASYTDTPHWSLSVGFDGRLTLAKDGVQVTDSIYIAPAAVDRLTLQQTYLELMVYPTRRNELLFWTNKGSYPRYVDTDIDPLEPNGKTFAGAEGYGDFGDNNFVISKYGHAAITFPTAKGFFQLTPVVYRCSPAGNGQIEAIVAPELPYAPDSTLFPDGEDVENVLQCSDYVNDPTDPAFAEMTPGLSLDGDDTTMNWAVLLHGHRPDPVGFPLQADISPEVYGFSYSVPNAAQTTDDDTTDITSYVRKLTRTYNENGSSCVLEFKDPLIADPTGSYMKALHRVCRLYQLDGSETENELFYGIATEPEYDEWPDSPDLLNHTPVTFRVEDWWWVLEHTQLINFRSLDGMKLEDAVRAILKVCRWPEDRQDIDTSIVTLPRDDKATERVVMADNAGSAKDLLLHLRDTYTTSDVPPYKWIMDFAPVLDGSNYKIKFRFKNPELAVDYTEPASTRRWYSTKAAAEEAQETTLDCARSYSRQILEPEANYAEVWGEDPNGVAISEIGEDTASQDPTTAFADRPDNWLGHYRPIVYQNSALNTRALVKLALEVLRRRLFYPRYIAEWTGAALHYDRLWDVHKMIHDDNRRYRITGMDVEHVLEASSLVIRNTTYQAEARE